jgi:hypothetical protein
VSWSQFKAHQESVSQLPFFASNLSWQLDIFHCIGAWNAADGDSSNKAYHLLHEGGVAGYVNCVLKNLLEGEEYENVSLTGYSLRRGGASTAAQNEHLTIHQIIQRGGWSINAVSTIFEYSLDLPQESYVGTFALLGGGLGGDVTGTGVRIAPPVFALVVHGWLRSARWRTSRPCGHDGLQVPPGCSAGFSTGSPLGSLEDT